MMNNTRPVGVLRYNAEVMRDNGAPQEVIAKYLSDNGSSIDQIMAVAKPNENELQRMLDSEKDGSFQARQQQFNDAVAKVQKDEERMQLLRNVQGDVRSIADGLLFGAGDEFESAVTGQPVADIRREQARFIEENPIRSTALGITGALLNPVARKGINVFKGAGLGSKIANSALHGAGYGAVYGFNSGEDELANRLANAGRSAVVSGVVSGAIPGAGKIVALGQKGAKAAVSGIKKGLDKTPFVGGVLGRNAEEIAAGAQEISGALPDNGEFAGYAVKNLADDLIASVKAKTSALYDKAEQLAAGRSVNLDGNSNFAKTFREVAGNTIKSGRDELNTIWNQIGHDSFDMPTYETAKAFRSWLSEKSVNGGTGLSKNQYGKLLEALDKDMEASLGKEAAAAKKAADAAFRQENKNADSITNSINKLIGKSRDVPISNVGNRAISSAQGKAWKASSLQKMLDEGEKIGSPYVADVKQALQANTTTRAQFNRMSPEQKLMVYGNKLPLAEKNFNGGALNLIEKLSNKSIDYVGGGMQKLLEALRPAPIVTGMSKISDIAK